MYVEALGWLQDSWLGEAARSGGFAYAAINSAHVLGAALLLGSIAVLDVLVLKGRTVLAAEVAKVAVPIAALGLAIQVPTGLALLAADARASGTNPAFVLKLGAIVLGVANVAALHLRGGFGLVATSAPILARRHAILSLLAWTVALVAGRMIAYV